MSLQKAIQELLDMKDPIEERVVQYIVREIKNGKTLAEVLNDPYVKNRIPNAESLMNGEIADVLLEKIRAISGESLDGK